jgi:outer membrane biosynthesis protein TonB
VRAVGLVVALGWLLAGPTFASSDPPAATAKLEAAVVMRVDAKIVIEPGGALGEIKIDTPLDPALQAALERVVRGWRFKPVFIDGVARRANTSMRVVLAALGEGKELRIVVDSVDFPKASNPEAVLADGQLAPIALNRVTPPRYPQAQMMGGVTAKILLGIRVTPDGRVGEVASIQSMLLQTKQGEAANRRNIRAFEAAAIAAAKQWTFKVPDSIVPRTVEQMTIAVPVVFSADYDPGVSGS